jgi:acetaldehyde dehydrogenase (acetylating)
MADSREALHAEAQALETAVRDLVKKIQRSYANYRIGREFQFACAHLCHAAYGLQMAKFALSEFMEEPK